MPLIVAPRPLLYSKAVVRLMPYAASLPDLQAADPTLAMHTNGGGTDNGSLFGWFARAGNDICSHFQVMLDGTVEQYVPLNKQAYAQYTGNRICWSVEHQDNGDPNLPLTAAQLAADADLIAELGVPARVTPITGGGVGWHSLYAEWNQSGHNCPGPVREAQFRALIKQLAAPIVVPSPPAIPEGDEVSVDQAVILTTALGPDHRPAALLDVKAGTATYLSSAQWSAMYHQSDLAKPAVTPPLYLIREITVKDHDAYTGGPK